VVFWLIDRKRESLELLADFLDAIPDAEMHVVRNMYLGPEKKFELYPAADRADRWEDRGVSPGEGGCLLAADAESSPRLSEPDVHRGSQDGALP